MKRIIECILIIIFGGAFSHAQQGLSATGGEGIGTGGTVSFTIGQTNYITIASDSGMVIQGVQQPYQILIVTGIGSNKEITLECWVYPNPSNDFLILRIQGDLIESLGYRLMDMNGKIIETNSIDRTETRISLKGYLPAPYYLKVTDGVKDIKTFKIIKSTLL